MGVLSQCCQSLSAWVAGFDPSCWRGEHAAAAVEVLARIERLAAAGNLLAAGRVEETHRWRADGARSAEDGLAAQTGTTRADAAGVLATAARVKDLPATAQALRAGNLSAPQA